MVGGWKEIVRDLRRALLGGVPDDPKKAAESERDKPPPSSFLANRAGAEIRADLGVDFGTRFTKVVMHMPHLGSRTPLSLGSDGNFHPARLAVQNRVAFPPDISAPPDATWVNYLKMRLSAGGVEFDLGMRLTREEIAALSALYLAGVLRLAQTSAFKSGRLHGGAVVKWFAQVGVPVKTYASGDLDLFEEMAAVAWAWKDEAPGPRAIDQLVSSYVRARDKRLTREESPIVVAPELVAAISHVAFRPDAPEGLYALLDIGAGTLDGTVFELRRTPRPAVDILAAQVEPLGTIPVARRIGSGEGAIEAAEQRLIAGRLTKFDEGQLTELKEKVKCVLHKVIAESVKKRPNLDFVTPGTSSLDSRIGTSAYRSINVLLAGGGAESRWYANAFESLNMHSWVVGKLKTRVIPRPSGWLEDNYPRFVVANGLSNRDLQLRGDYQLPPDIPDPPPPPNRKAPIESPTSKDFV